jgi:hypothetical protein
MCKKIHRGGNAEYYYADKKYKEAVAVAVEACAEDTRGKKCYICTQALHWRTKEGLVRGCACRRRGVAHVSCLAEQAKIIVAEAEENNSDWDVVNKRLERWSTCSLCEQDYHGVVKHALAWACWKTYVGRPEKDQVRMSAVSTLGESLRENGQYGDARVCWETLVAVCRATNASDGLLLQAMVRLYSCYEKLLLVDEVLDMQREVYRLLVRLEGSCSENTLDVAIALSTRLMEQNRYHEAKKFLCEAVEGSEKFLGRDHVTTIQIKLNYARALWGYHLYGYDGYRDDLRKAIEILEDLVQLDPIRSGLFDAREEEKGEMDQSQAIVGALVRARNEQLDWCIHDLTPATFEAYRDS